MGVLICGSSEGICVVANKVKGVRAGSVFTVQNAKLVRVDNDANIICLAGRELTTAQAKKLVETFLKTKPSQHPRHKRRINKITAYELKHLR
jgi:ribose 5-phosphate isomerase B